MTRDGTSLTEILGLEYLHNSTKYSPKYNKSTQFLLPMIGLDLRNKLLLRYLVNCFIEDKGIEHDFVRPLFILLKVKNYVEKDFVDLQRALKHKGEPAECFISDYYVGEDPKTNANLLMFVFQTPERYKNDYYNFKKGRYSLFSPEYKKKFQKEALSEGGKIVESKAYGAIYRTNTMKDFVAMEFTVKDEKTGKPLNSQDFTQLRNFLDSCDEVWDAPKKEDEYFRYQNQH